MALLILTCALLWIRERREPPPSTDALTVEPAVTAPAPAPRLAPAPASPNADQHPARVRLPKLDAATDSDSLDEATLMENIRVALTSKPHMAETMVREAARRFAASELAEVRDMMLIIALSNQVKNDEARAEAYAYFERYPGGRYTKDIFSLLNVSPKDAR
jgi:hypothetical protein